MLLVKLEEGLGFVAVSKRKETLRRMVHDIKLAPEALTVTAVYKIPGHTVTSNLAGGGFEPPTSGL